MRLTVVGAGPAYTDLEGSSGACYLVADGSTRVLLDLGHGSFSRLFSIVRPTELDAVVVSHLHPDHFIDLVPLRHYLRYEFDPPRRTQVLGPTGLEARLDALHAEPGFAAEALDIALLREGAFRIGTLEIRTQLVTHAAESYAMRVTAAGGAGLVYSGDCGRAEDLAPLVKPGDVLLIEVSFGPGPVATGAMHLDGPAVGRLAATSRASRVLLTHLLMGHDPASTIASVVRAGYDGPVEFAWPGTSVEI